MSFFLTLSHFKKSYYEKKVIILMTVLKLTSVTLGQYE